MKWYFINNGFNPGEYNMDFDIRLAESCGNDEAYLRLYRWNPFCISLGANQNYDLVNFEKTAKDKIDVAKRPTGGRAILHAEEITYSVVYPLKNLSSLRNLYYEINKALKLGLTIYNERLIEAELETEQHDFKSFYKNNLSGLCFAVSAKSEIKYRGKKLIGSAQRKIGSTVLQHGSVLCGGFHKKIIDYLYLSDEEYSLMKNLMINKTTDLGEILNEEIDYERLINCLINGFETHFSIQVAVKDKPIFEQTEHHVIR
jgi:lipoyl(octanoyl) transferase